MFQTVHITALVLFLKNVVKFTLTAAVKSNLTFLFFIFYV